MNKSNIVSAISIRFILNKDEAKKTVDNVFKIMTESMKDNKSLNIPKFGKFKLISSETGKDKFVRFLPSKKLSKKINYDFSDLEKKELSYSEPESVKVKDEFSYTISKEFLKQKKESEGSGENLSQVKDEIAAGEENTKKLISDELVKLHHEIIEFSQGNQEGSNNLWG